MNFHEVRFPAALSVGSSGGPERRTEIVTLKNGFEERNSPWAHSRRRYDAGLGVRSLDDLAEVIAFFEARHGQLYGFRWKDWTDFKSCAPSAAPSATDQAIGTGDGARKAFELEQDAMRRGRSPTCGRSRSRSRGRCGWRCRAWRWRRARFTVDAGRGQVFLAVAPAAGALVTAGFEFDVPVRFDSDRISDEPRGVRGGRDPVDPGGRGAGLMRAIDPELQARLDGGATRLCRCWLVRRRDGSEIGLHRPRRGRRVRRGGLSGEQRHGRERAAVGDGPERGQRPGGRGAERAPRSARRTSGPGKYDGAEIRQWLVDWERPELRVLMFRGQPRRDPPVGRRLRGGAARAGGGAERAGRAGRCCGPATGRSGTRSAGSTRASRGSRARAWSKAAAGASLSASGLGGFAAGWFTHGALTWLSGGNAGEKAAVKIDRPGEAGAARADAVAGAGAEGRGGRPVPGGGRLRQAGRDLPGEVRQPDQLSRVPAHPGRRLGDGLPQGWSDP